jgi:hypothetical protein
MLRAATQPSAPLTVWSHTLFIDWCGSRLLRPTASFSAFGSFACRESWSEVWRLAAATAHLPVIGWLRNHIASLHGSSGSTGGSQCQQQPPAKNRSRPKARR